MPNILPKCLSHNNVLYIFLFDSLFRTVKLSIVNFDYAIEENMTKIESNVTQIIISKFLLVSMNNIKPIYQSRVFTIIIDQSC